MYPFYTDTRGWGLVNAMSADESAPVKNVRVTGNGTLYGNGWKYGVGSTIYKDGLTSNKGENKQSRTQPIQKLGDFQDIVMVVI